MLRRPRRQSPGALASPSYGYSLAVRPLSPNIPVAALPVLRSVPLAPRPATVPGAPETVARLGTYRTRCFRHRASLRCFGVRIPANYALDPIAERHLSVAKCCSVFPLTRMRHLAADIATLSRRRVYGRNVGRLNLWISDDLEAALQQRGKQRTRAAYARERLAWALGVAEGLELRESETEDMRTRLEACEAALADVRDDLRRLKGKPAP